METKKCAVCNGTKTVMEHGFAEPTMEVCQACKKCPTCFDTKKVIVHGFTEPTMELCPTCKPCTYCEDAGTITQHQYPGAVPEICPKCARPQRSDNQKAIYYCHSDITKSDFWNDRTFNAEVIPGKQIRIFGENRNHHDCAQQYDKTFKIGDEAEFDSYNTSFHGKILSIGKKTVTIQGYGKKRRLSLEDFSWRNYDFTIAKVEHEQNNYYD